MKSNKTSKPTPTQNLLQFLESYATNGSMRIFETIVKLLHKDDIEDIVDIVSEKLQCKYPDFLDYFETVDDIERFMVLKDENPEKYYTIVQYVNILLNFLCYILDIPQIVVLNPDDLSKSCFLMVKLKN